MNQEQQAYISYLNHASTNEIHIKHTEREGINLPIHQHNKHQIVYTLSGTLHVQTETISYFIPEHHIAWIPAGMSHKLSSNNRQVKLLIFYCDAIPDMTKDPIHSLSIYGITPFIMENLKFMASTGNIISRERQPDLYHFTFSFFRLLPFISRSCELPLQSQVIPANSRLRPVLLYITEHIRDNLTIEQIAAQFGFSVRNLSRLFQNENLRFSNYLNYQRITRAIELFAAHDMTLQEIAYEVGFNSPNHFSRVFKQLLGVSPKEFYTVGIQSPPSD